MSVIGKLGKKVLSGCLVVGITLTQLGIFPVRVSAADSDNGLEYLLNVDFTKINLSEVINDGWVATNGTGTISSVEEDGKNVLKITNSVGNGKTSFVKSGLNITQSVNRYISFETKVKLGEISSNAQLNFPYFYALGRSKPYSTLYVDNNGMGTHIRNTSEGSSSENSGTKTRIADQSVGKWRTIRMDYDLKQNNYNIFVDNELVLYQGKTRNDHQAFDKLEFYLGDGVNKGTLYFEYIKIWKTDGPLVKSHTEPQVYYVSSEGNDESAGTSQATSWKSLERVNAETFIPGDKILFKRGDKWQNKTLYPKGSGGEGKPIKIASYGDSQAALPAIAANAQVNDAVYLFNQEYWEISELDVSNTSEGYTGERNGTNGALLKDLRGIHITGKDVDTLSGINLHNLYVHDVTGYDAWIGGLNDTNTTNWKEPGIIMNTGWDFSKRTGGILIEALKPSGNTPTIFKNVTLTDSTLEHNSFGAFTIKQWNGGSNGPKWAQRNSNATPPYYNDSNFKPHENITVKGNYIDQSGDYNANGIYITSAKNVLVEDNVVKNPGVCGIELYFVDNAIVQHNEVYGSRAKAGGADSNGIDPDRHVTNTIIQYNYVHDNGDGILVCGFAYNSVIIRYNLLKDVSVKFHTHFFNINLMKIL